MSQQNNESPVQYRVWGADNAAYGPVELPTLVSWLRDDRVNASTWIHLDHEGRWAKANSLPELSLFFTKKAGDDADPATISTETNTTAHAAGLKPGALRRIRVFAGMDDKQLQTFLYYLDLVQVRQFALVVRKGDTGDSMFMVLEGELRALTRVDGKETTLGTIGVGEFFGEVSLLDQAPRSADVAANTDATLLRITAGGLERMVREAPSLVAPFSMAIGRTVAGRLRQLTKRFEDSIQRSRTAGIPD